MCDGENELLVALGDGWHRSTGGVDGDRDLFGDTLGVLFQLEVDGQAVCVSDGTMQATQCGPIRQNDMQQGEVYDARLEGHLTGWHGVRTYRDELPITGMNTVPILEHEAFPGKLLQTPNGETVLDFGQNIAGYVEMALTARAGQKVKLTCGEALDENGNFTQENFQDRARHKEGGTAQMLELVCKEGKNHFRPHFTIMGFRYAKVETDADLTDAVFTAHAVYSDMAVTGKFTCGNDAVNQLVKNSIWSQKGNFCDIPTRRLDRGYGRVYRNRPDPDGLLPRGGKMAGGVPPEPVPGRAHGEHCPAERPPRLYDPDALHVGRVGRCGDSGAVCPVQTHG